MNEDERRVDDPEAANLTEGDEILAPDEGSTGGQPAGAGSPDPLDRPSGGGDSQKAKKKNKKN